MPNGSYASIEDSIENCYYLDSIKITGNIGEYGTESPETYMKSKEFYNTLNKNKVWKYVENSYPELKFAAGTMKETTDLNIKNTIKTYNITTEIAPNSKKKRTGGTITGIYNDEYTSENNIKYVETIIYNNNSTQAIEIIPQSGYRIDKITINGDKLEFTTDDNGNVILPIGYFENVKEDKHIVVKFEQNPNLIIHKVDEDDTNIKLPNAKFKLEYNVSINPNTLIGEMQSSSTYKFTASGGKFISNNKGVSNSTANAYFPIDLTGQTGNFYLYVNASVSSESSFDCGYATITPDTTVPSYDKDSNNINTIERFMYISGTQNNITNSVNLIGGKKYYLHIGYRKDGSVNTASDTFTINSISLSGNAVEKECVEVETDSNGQAKAAVSINTNVKITEILTPKGYTPKPEPIETQVNGSELKEITITNKKVDNKITINKKDKNIAEPIPNTKFVIYSLNEENKEDDFAKDYNDNYLGTKEGDKYVLTTDENGQINVRPKPGMYKAVEIESAEGYFLEEEEYLRTSYFKIENPGIDYEAGQDEIEVGNPDLVINNLEDLVRLSNAVNSGNSYEGKTIVLARDLDFNEDSSYNNPNDTSFGDYDGDGTTNSIKQELSTGGGLKTIGLTEDKPFKGTFDGKGHEIKNICVNNHRYNTKGLFGYIKSGRMLNLGVAGNGSFYSGSYTGGIIYTAEDSIINNCYNDMTFYAGPGSAGIVTTLKNSTISNCYNTGNVSAGGYSAGIAYEIIDSMVENCYNTGSVSGSGNCGGIVYNATGSKISNCYNTGAITSGYSTSGGIVGYNATNCEIINCHNSGTISGGSGSGGIVGYDVKDNTTIKNCYNIGEISVSDNSGNTYAGGIIGCNSTNSKIVDCYNNGNVTSNRYAGGLVGNTIQDNSLISSCYNMGSVIGGDATVGGLVGINALNSKIIDCYNEGNLTSNVLAGGLVGNSASNSEIIGCYNKGNLSSRSPVGGIATFASDSRIENCYNIGNIDASSGPAGGISEALTRCIVNNCYNSGNVTAGVPAGGLSYSISDSEVVNFYNTGEITSNINLVGGIAQSPSNSKFTNCYYLNTTAEKGIYNQNDIKGVVEAKIEEEMKSEDFAKLLNKNIKNINSEIPLFKWNYKENAYPELDGISVKKEMTFINEKAQKVIVHHYLEGTGPEYGNDPITFEEAPDEELVGKLGEEYTSTPHMDIPKHTLIKDETGEYVIPENASGEFTEEVQHVYYYYNKNKVNLTVHHYLEGTENKVPLGQNEQGEDRFAEDEHSEYDEGDHYKTNASEEVLQKYELVEVVGDEEKDIMQDEVVIYYYKIKSHEITTRVEIPEGRSEDEKGGQISGEGEKPYEIVDHEKASIKDILITPDAGYRVKQIRLVSTNEEGNTQESIIYIDGSASEKEEAENAEITYTQKEDGTIILTKFENMTEDKEVIVVFEKNEGRLIVHHYIEDTQQKIYDDQITIKPVGTKVETKPVKVGNYVLVEGPADRNATITNETQEKTYYYQEQYKITTEVIKHSEDYKDGTTKNNIAGGEIEDEGQESHELVLKNRPNQEEVEINPNLGYEVVEITIKDGKDAKEGIKLDFEQYKEKDANGKETGKVILPKGLFQSMQSDKHIQVEFRKKTNVIVKHLEVGTENVLYRAEQGKDYEELKGYEGQEFETSRKVIPNYMAAEVEIIESTSEGEEHVSKSGITDENKEHMAKYSKVQTDEKSYVNGKMYADTLTIIYWYTRVPSGIIVRHIETNEKAEEKELESKLVDGLAGLEQPTTRNKYDKYIPVDRKEENKGNTNENVTIMSKDQDSKTLTFAEDKTLEVWYFYEKEYNVTTEVKLHEETTINPETGEIETKQVAGGTISKKYEKDEQGNDKLDDKGNKIEAVYEKILLRGDSKEEIEIKPDSGYRIKAVTKQKKVIIDGKETYESEQVFIENIIKEDGSLVLGESKQDESEQEESKQSYLTDVQHDYNIVVEFERIPAKVIVEYKDSYTKESIAEDKVVDGYVNDEYSEPRLDIESYIPADPEPENGEGTMTKETITITYWYTKQFKITTDVKEHEEDDGEGNKVSIKGGKISGEDESPYEIVTRGEDSTKEIKIVPEDGYRIKSLAINGTEIETKDLQKEDGSLTMSLFENMQEDKHVEVEFERIPAKVIVRYLDVETKEPIVDDETIDGYVNKDYETEQKDLKYYELVEEKYPENDKGTMTKEDITVKYYYRKLKFNMKIEKEIQSIKVNGQEAGIDLQNNKHAKLEVEYSKIEDTNIEVSYKIKVTNTEKIAGTATLEEQVPEEFEFVRTGSDENWLSRSEFEEKFIENYTESQKSNWPSRNETIYMLRTKELQSGETAEYSVTLRWKAKNSSKGEKVNIAKITNTENEPSYEETTLDDNEDKAIVEIKVNRTIQDIIDDIKNGKTDGIILGIKTGDVIIIFAILIITAGITMIVAIKVRGLNGKKGSKKIRLVKNNKHKE